MPEKLHTHEDMGGGLVIANSLNPVNLQEAATKNYVDDYHLRFGRYQVLWEDEYSMQCSSAAWSNAVAHITTGPIDRTYTKLYPETAICVTGTFSCWDNVQSAQMVLCCSVNGGSILHMCGLFSPPVNEHHAFPVGIRYFLGGVGNYLGTATGPMVVAWYMWVSNASTTVSTDGNDRAAWTVSEVRYF